MAKQLEFLLVEPTAKTPYPPLGLMKISSMLRAKHKGCVIHSQTGAISPINVRHPRTIYVTTLFTWDIEKDIAIIKELQKRFPKSEIKVGGISASLMPNHIQTKTGISPHIGLLPTAENHKPDYTLTFGRHLSSSITSTTRGCIRKCKFCAVTAIEPIYQVRNHWQNDISDQLPDITFWDNNWLASPKLERDCKALSKLNKKVDFNQGLDARLYDSDRAKLLSSVHISPMRFAFDSIGQEKAVLRAIRLAKNYSLNDIRTYVLYNFTDTPEDFYTRIDVTSQLPETAKQAVIPT